jgi:hypothetical protein
MYCDFSGKILNFFNRLRQESIPASHNNSDYLLLQPKDFTTVRKSSPKILNHNS